MAEEWSDYFYYMTGRWKDGTRFSKRTIHGEKAGPDTRFHFNANPFDTLADSELSRKTQPTDRTGMGSTGPFTLYPGDTLKSLWAFTFHRASSGTREDAYKLMLKEVPEVKKLYAQTGLNSPCKSAIGVNVGETRESGIALYPNPAKNYVQIESDHPIDLVRILSIDGRVLRVLESNENTVDISTLQSGLYLLEVSIPSGASMHRLVKE